MNLILNDKPAIKINATLHTDGIRTATYDCEGDLVCFPKKCTEYDPLKKTLLIEEWLYDVKVAGGEL